MFVISFAHALLQGSPKGKAEISAHHSRARQFSKYDFPRCREWLRSGSLANNLPGGAPERIKRGKEKVVTRAVANAEMEFFGTSERGITALSELK